jgi:hypothetical protein
VAKLSKDQIKQTLIELKLDPSSNELILKAVRESLDYLAQEFPGNSVELRVPPIRVVQLMQGVDHRRGTPPSVIEVSPDTWLKFTSKEMTWQQGLDLGLIQASGQQSEKISLILSNFLE